MADTKITDLSSLSGASIATGDVFVLVDVSDTSMAASGTNKKTTASDVTTAVKTLGNIKAPTRQTFTSGSGTYTTPAGCTAIDVEVCAGGGGGGGADGGSGTAAAGSGGGSGGWLRKLIASPSATYSYAVGSGGAGGTAGPNSGAAGNDSTFGSSLLTAKGGSGGDGTMSTGTTADDAQGGAGGTVSTGGDFNSGGNPGDHGTRQSAGRVLGGNGGATPYGAGGRGGRSSAAGGAGVGYGSGGGGATATTTTDRAGGDGAGGIIIVTEYYG